MSASGRLDTQGVWEATAAQAAQLEQLVAQLAVLAPVAPVTAWVLLGTGSGRLATQVVAAFVGAKDRRPIVWLADHALPAFVGPGTGVLTVEGQGDGALGPVRTEARRRGATVYALAAGDAGAGDAGAGDEPLLSLPTVGSTGRVAVAHAVAGALGVLAAGTAEHEGALTALGDGVRQLHRRSALLADASAADDVARRIGRTVPLIYGAGLPGLAARHWKAQVNLTAKTPAFAGLVPDVLDDELAGWGQDGDVTRQVLTLIALRHQGEIPEVAAAYDTALTAVDEVMGDVVSVWAEGESDLIRFMDLAYVGDIVSLSLAVREGIDPGPVSIGAGHGLAR
ncbi:MAG TPA: SIS domain-containing protein [Acidimicrobiales bacterium]